MDWRLGLFRIGLFVCVVWAVVVATQFDVVDSAAAIWSHNPPRRMRLRRRSEMLPSVNLYVSLPMRTLQALNIRHPAIPTIRHFAECHAIRRRQIFGAFDRNIGATAVCPIRCSSAISEICGCLWALIQWRRRANGTPQQGSAGHASWRI